MERENEKLTRLVTPPSTGHGSRVLSGVRAYWEALRGPGGSLPARMQIDARGIAHALDHAFILERVGPGIGRFRVAGTYLNDLMGMEVRGMPLTAFFAAPARRVIAEATEAVFADPAIAELSLAGDTGFGKPALTGRLLLLPLRSDLGDVTRALGCLVAEGGIGRTPRRFSVTDSALSPLYAAGLAGHDPFATPASPSRPDPVRPAVLELAEPAAAFATAPDAAARRRLFRIVASRD